MSHDGGGASPLRGPADSTLTTLGTDCKGFHNPRKAGESSDPPAGLMMCGFNSRADATGLVASIGGWLIKSIWCRRPDENPHASTTNDSTKSSQGLALHRARRVTRR